VTSYNEVKKGTSSGQAYYKTTSPSGPVQATSKHPFGPPAHPPPTAFYIKENSINSGFLVKPTKGSFIEIKRGFLKPPKIKDSHDDFSSPSDKESGQGVKTREPFAPGPPSLKPTVYYKSTPEKQSLFVPPKFMQNLVGSAYGRPVQEAITPDAYGSPPPLKPFATSYVEVKNGPAYYKSSEGLDFKTISPPQKYYYSQPKEIIYISPPQKTFIFDSVKKPELTHNDVFTAPSEPATSHSKNPGTRFTNVKKIWKYLTFM
jgi:hypothetical protein